MNVVCALCRKEIRSIDKIFQFYTQECRVDIEIFLQDDHGKQTMKSYCNDVLMSWVKYFRGNATYRLIHPDHKTYSYYCAKCGPSIKKAEIYLGGTTIKQKYATMLYERSFIERQSTNRNIINMSPKRRVYCPAVADTNSPLLGAVDAMSFSGYGGFDTPPKKNLRDSSENELYDLDYFESDSCEKIRNQAKFISAYDIAMANAKYPALFVALYVLSKKFKSFVAEANTAKRSFTVHLYKKCTGIFNPRSIIQDWLQEASDMLDELKTSFCNIGVLPEKMPFYLHCSTRLTESAVETLLVKADKSYFIRPSYAKHFIFFAIAFLGLLVFVIHRFGLQYKGNPEPHYITTLRPSLTTTTLVTPPLENPCYFSDECTRYVYQQILDKLRLLNQNGYTTVKQVYRHCNNETMFNTCRDICFATNPNFAELLQYDDLIQGLINFFEHLLATR